MSAFPNNAKEERNASDNFGRVFVNQAKRSELRRRVAADEKEYDRYINQRPQGGSGILGGHRIENKNMAYEPDEFVILQTMETMDIDYNEARILLIMQNEERTNDGAVQRRRLLLSKVRERERKKREHREKRDREAKKRQEDEIQKKKDRARLKGLKNSERKRHQQQMEMQVSRMHANKRREARVKALDKSGGNNTNLRNCKLSVSKFSQRHTNNHHNNCDDYNNNNIFTAHQENNTNRKISSTAKNFSGREYWEARAMQLLEENQKLKHRNENLIKSIEILQLQSGHGIGNANPPSASSHQAFMGSEEWRHLLECDEITREATLQYLYNTAREAENGNTSFPTVSYAIACVRDTVNESIPASVQWNNTGNTSTANINVENPEMESSVDDNDCEREDEEMEERKPTPEELRALRLSRYS